MTYQPFLIANFATGLDNRMQPWLSTDEAQQEIFDGFVYRGVLSKRTGYTYFATGEQGGAPYRESRIIHTLTAVAMVGAINGINTVFTLAGTGQIARGSVTVSGSNPVQSFTDNGLGAFTGAGGSVNYITGAITITLPAAPIALSTVTVTYSFMPANPVMMIATFIDEDNVKELIVADTDYVNRYDPLTNTLVDISPAAPYTGTNSDFFTWTMYASATNTPRLLFANNAPADVIQQWDGTTVTDYVYTMNTSAAIPAPVTDLNCSWMAEFKDRLILLRTIENGVVYPQRIRISGTGASSDDFRKSATGAGFIDIPDGTWIKGADFNRDDLMIFTESATWSLKYTGNDTTPFVLDKIDASRGSDATFSVITYLNRTTAAAPRGLIISDGYKVERADESIPDFSFNEIDSQNFELCFAGTVDEDRDHYLIYPSDGQTTSNRILVTNYDEDTYTIYRIPLSCMGSFFVTRGVNWNSLLKYNNWEEFAADYGDWNHFGFIRQSPISLGGGHKGEIWSLNVEESKDNPVKIRNITKINSTTLEITTDWNNYSYNTTDNTLGADIIYFTAVVGMGEINHRQFSLDTTFGSQTNNVFRIKTDNNTNWSAYTSGGTASRVIPFTALTKQFNPFINQDKKVRCGWIYMYVDSTATNLHRNIPITAATNANPCVITTEIQHGLETGAQVNFFGVGGMTELNGNQYFITVLSSTTFSLTGINSTAYGVYTAGGYAGAVEPAKLAIDVYRDDTMNEPTQLMFPPQDPYQGNCTNLTFEDGVKKWYKVFINQTGRFIQFRFRNAQAGATINIQAMTPAFQPVGRIL